MADRFDAVVIGGGPGGYNAAIRLGQLGLKGAGVRRRGTVGGTCLDVGCIPSEGLAATSEIFAEGQNRFAGLGIKVQPSLDLAAMMGHKNKVVSELTRGVDFLLRKYKAEAIVGSARIASPGKVEIKDQSGAARAPERKTTPAPPGSPLAPLPPLTLDE